jgi:tol-pal system protein YbgF
MNQKIFLCILIIFSAVLPKASAGTKEELLRLQNDVLALQTQIREFEKSFNEKTDGLKSLVVQLNDQVAKSSLVLTKVTTTLEAQASGVRTTDQQLLQEIRSLSGKIDDTATRISILAQQIADLKVQSKALNQPGPAGSGLSEEAIYNQALQDLIQENFDLAIQGFTAYLSSFPAGSKAAAAQYNIGESYRSQNKLPQAIAAFSRVINEYSGSDQVAIALFRRGKAELAMQESENAIADFKAIVERYPTTSEAGLAKKELQSLGVDLSKPKDTRRKTR